MRPFWPAGLVVAAPLTAILATTAVLAAFGADRESLFQASSPANSSQTEPQAAGTSGLKIASSTADDAHFAKPRWETLARSPLGRPIEMATFGSGARRVLVVGPLEGDDRAAVAFTTRLAEHLAGDSQQLDGATVTIVRDPNPDGRARQTPGNARGVLLDRNFPTNDWRKQRSGERLISGRLPQSEIETQALAGLIASVKPACVVLLAATRGRPSVEYAGGADELARRMGVETQFPVIHLSTAQHGSLTGYVGIDRAIGMLRITVSAHASTSDDWNAYQRALLLAIGGTAEGSASDLVAVERPGRRLVISPPVPVGRSGAARSVLAVSAANPRSEKVTSPMHRYEDVRRGMPLAPVTKSAAPKTPHPTPAVANVSATDADEIVRRLPPIGRVAPATIVNESGLPQPPIPLYPDTGYE